MRDNKIIIIEDLLLNIENQKHNEIRKALADLKDAETSDFSLSEDLPKLNIVLEDYIQNVMLTVEEIKSLVLSISHNVIKIKKN